MKEKEKIQLLDTILIVSIFMISISAILKLMGMNFFGLELESQIVNAISEFLKNNYIFDNIMALISLTIQAFVFYQLCCKNPDTKLCLFVSLDMALINLSIQNFFLLAPNDPNGTIYSIISLVLLVVPSWFINKKIILKKPIGVFALLLTYQMITVFIRNITYNEQFVRVYNLLLNFDFIILLIITYYLYLKRKGSEVVCQVATVQNGAGFYSVLKNLLQGLQTNYQNFSSKDRQEKAEIIIYIILSALWECFTLGLLLFVAVLNHTLIECLFIITSFLITKGRFGTPFHFKSAWACFIVSNLSYYALNRITLSIGISFIVPVTLGILLSYGTSKLVKRPNREIYRGMPEQELLNICQELTEQEVNILRDFYCNKKTLVALSLKYHYSEKSIYNYKKNALKKLKELA